MRESTVEKHLCDKVAKAGGATRKFSSAYRKNNPDQIVIWPRMYKVKGLGPQVSAAIHFVETKAPGKKPRSGQVREHQRLRDLGCDVLVLDTKELIDQYVAVNR
jgi:hypothetical protein